eukprot:10063069-Ditylum_brightwellii.AAC.1
MLPWYFPTLEFDKFSTKLSCSFEDLFYHLVGWKCQQFSPILLAAVFLQLCDMIGYFLLFRE